MTEGNERRILNELIVICREAARGFEWAAEHVRNPELQGLFTEIATERHQYVTELLTHAWWLGGPPDGDGSRMAALHRTWMAVKDRISPDHDHAILLEAERGERAALARYQRAAEEALPALTRDVITTQLAGMQTVYGQLETLAATV